MEPVEVDLITLTIENDVKPSTFDYSEVGLPHDALVHHYDTVDRLSFHKNRPA